MVEQSARESDEQLESFMARYSADVASVARGAVKKLIKRLPAANRLVYDNYNALAIAFSANEKQSGIILSIALYPRWASLFLVGGQRLPDPNKRLKGSGSTMRHVVLESARTLDEPAVAALIDAAVAIGPLLPVSGKGATLIKSISAKQRPRQP
ncbi:MAG: hypothetical protein ABI740_08255 [Alphaproteobacteria bacterium]